jgi:L-seryl-tRNA(Ser) seleniumtransferase
LAVHPVKSKHASLKRLEEALRLLPRPVIARISDGALWLDVRCLEPQDEPQFLQQLAMLRVVMCGPAS